MLTIIQTISSVRGTNRKKAFLKKAGDSNLLFKKLLVLAYDPFQRFHNEHNAFLALEKAGIISPQPELIRRVFKKNLEMGIAAKGINSIWPGLIPQHDVMLAQKLEWHRVKYPCWATVKLDGVRAIYRDGAFYFRNGKKIRGLSKFTDALSSVGHTLDGELLIPGIPFQKSSGLIRSYNETPEAEFHIIDVPEAPSRTLARRLNPAYYYESQIKRVHVVPAALVNQKQSIELAYNNAIAAGYEGLVIKPVKYKYVGKRSYDWMKMKAIESEDLYVVDIFKGCGKYAGMLGGVIVDFSGVRVRCGSGFTDLQRNLFWADPDNIIGHMVEIEYHEITPDGSLRHPRFKGFRDDKEEI